MNYEIWKTIKSEDIKKYIMEINHVSTYEARVILQRLIKPHVRKNLARNLFFDIKEKTDK